MIQVAFVFHRLRSPDNLGSIARAMKSFGLSRLVLAEPETYAFGEAEKLAVKSLDLLDSMRVERSLPAALAPYSFVAGSTSRALPQRPALTARQLALQLQEERARGEVAVLFGGEKRGLSDAELELCQAVVTLPTRPPQPSLNVAQAAGILAYELAMLEPTARPPAEPRAERALVEQVLALMQAVLLHIKFLNPQNPDHILGELRQLIDRAGPTPREASLLLTAFKKLERGLRR